MGGSQSKSLCPSCVPVSSEFRVIVSDITCTTEEWRCRRSEPKRSIAAYSSDHRGSNNWWINYYIDGKQHREKAGTKQAAISLYQKRKTDDREGKKLPDLRSKRFVTVAELIDDALVRVQHHKDLRNYESKGCHRQRVPEHHAR